MAFPINTFDRVGENLADRYFYLEGLSNSKKYTETGYEIEKKSLTKKQIVETIGKIASYFTIIFPLIFLIKKAIDANKARKVNSLQSGKTHLYRAVIENDLQKVHMLLKTRGIDVNKRSSEGMTPLHGAILNIKEQEEKDLNAPKQILRLLLQAANIDTEMRTHAKAHRGYVGGNETARDLAIARFGPHSEVLTLLSAPKERKDKFLIDSRN